ncbi:MAG: LOG family protein [Pseudomonadota bacterium]
MSKPRHSVFPSADTDAHRAEAVPDTPQGRSPSYRLAWDDDTFLRGDALRPVRLQLEMLKPELAMQDRGIASTVVFFGGARVPAPEEAERVAAVKPQLAALAPFYGEARALARLVGEECLRRGGRDFVVVTGGGPGVMEAGNRGAEDVGAPSIGLNIVLPSEQQPNPHITPELCFQFHYFGIRKMHFLMRARALVVFPGGFGTLDELFETLTLIQTKRMAPIPVVLFGEAFWRSVVNWEALRDAGVIAENALELIAFAETAADGWTLIRDAVAPGAGEGAL